MTITQAVERMNAIYTEARAQLAEQFAVLDSARAKREEIRGNKFLSADGKAAEENKLDAAIRAARTNADRISAETAERLAEVKRAAVAETGGKFRIRPADIDAQAVELLKSGIMTDAELIELAAEFPNNTTMKRLLSAEMKRRADADRGGKMFFDLQSKAAELAQNPLDSILDNFAEICTAGTRADATLANGVNNRLYSNSYEKALAEAAEADN